ncbi:MAG: hypothetical protein QW611_03405 [Ignisphaera sp.]
MAIRLISQIVVSLVLLSVVVVAAISSGLTMTRTLSSYRLPNLVYMRVDTPSVDVFYNQQDVVLKISFKVMYLGDTDTSIVGVVTYVLLKGTTGRSMILQCPYVDLKTLAPGSVAILTPTCRISRSDLVNLFSSSWTGDIVKMNTYYLYSKVYYIYRSIVYDTILQ